MICLTALRSRYFAPDAGVAKTLMFYGFIAERIVGLSRLNHWIISTAAER